MYSINYKVTTSTCDSEGKLKLYSALQMMQDCSEMWIDSEPEVKDYFLQQNMAQLLATRQVEIIRVPDYQTRLRLSTCINCVTGMFWCFMAFTSLRVSDLKRLKVVHVSDSRIDMKTG